MCVHITLLYLLRSVAESTNSRGVIRYVSHFSETHHLTDTTLKRTLMNHNTTQYNNKLLPIKGRAILVQDWTGLEGSRRLMLSDFMTTGTFKW